MEMYQKYRKALVELVNSIDAENGLEEENAVLILHKLNSEERISRFAKWVESRLVDGKLQATETEICRAAVQAAREV